ncbi:hypothetical protein TVAG_043540 [Trichomonas vaginalis G3]|uniref:Uncharacterized protein n=1 Tax=Trichomonas vaginalis (strain ATCC PRA-98 / G3) TaxID=412133 RepID=A2EV94_TRIV3|nr:armadillo (ARM) repeat-containing protein family [Trichomonas vaginalis G3]EAY03408.1 hypothetical protein TVAG_043540 [Trichomonas vaginalis G3]KAI5540186.1 armadillo (ARM) repeat-containing protein family [Trichomonas vaginalis G3]|eukprot:XP_001315631.1 hypothetical protein [Trichomonas vaginalis G3]
MFSGFDQNALVNQFLQNLPNIRSGDDKTLQDTFNFFNSVFNQNPIQALDTIATITSQITSELSEDQINDFAQAFILLKNFFSGHFISQNDLPQLFNYIYTKDDNQQEIAALQRVKTSTLNGLFSDLPIIPELCSSCLSGLFYYMRGNAADIITSLSNALSNDNFSNSQKRAAFRATIELLEDYKDQASFFKQEIRPIYLFCIKFPYSNYDFTNSECQDFLELTTKCLTQIITKSNDDHYKTKPTTYIILRVVSKTIQMACQQNTFEAVIQMIFKLIYFYYNMKFREELQILMFFVITILNINRSPPFFLFQNEILISEELIKYFQENTENIDEFTEEFDKMFCCPSFDDEKNEEILKILIQQYIDFTGFEYSCIDQSKCQQTFETKQHSFGKEGIKCKFPYTFKEPIMINENFTELMVTPLINIFVDSFSKIENPDYIDSSEMNYYLAYQVKDLLSRLTYYDMEHVGPAIYEILQNSPPIVGSWGQQLIFINCLSILVSFAQTQNINSPVFKIIQENRENVFSILLSTELPIIFSDIFGLLFCISRNQQISKEYLLTTFPQSDQTEKDFFEMFFTVIIPKVMSYGIDELTGYSFLVVISFIQNNFSRSLENYPVDLFNNIYTTIRDTIFQQNFNSFTIKHLLYLLSVNFSKVSIRESIEQAKEIMTFGIELLDQIDSFNMTDQDRFLIQDEFCDFFLYIIKSYKGNIMDEIVALAQKFIVLLHNPNWLDNATPEKMKLVVECIEYYTIDQNYLSSDFIPLMFQMINSDSPDCFKNGCLMLGLAFSKMGEGDIDLINEILSKILEVLETRSFSSDFIPSVCECIAYILKMYELEITVTRNDQRNRNSEYRDSGTQKNEGDDGKERPEMVTMQELVDYPDIVDKIIEIFRLFTRIPFLKDDPQQIEMSNAMFVTIFHSFKALITILSTNQDIIQRHKKFLLETPTKAMIEFRDISDDTAKAFLDFYDAAVSYLPRKNNIFLNRSSFHTALLYIMSKFNGSNKQISDLALVIYKKAQNM